MTGIAELQALGAAGPIVRGVLADRWHAATPCTGWDARSGQPSGVRQPVGG